MTVAILAFNVVPLLFFVYSEILALGFDKNFIRTWEYYFDYSAAGFKSYTLGDYQVHFYTPNNNFLLFENIEFQYNS